MTTRTTARALQNERFLTAGGTETFLLFELGYPLRDFCAFEVVEDEASWNRLVEGYVRPIAEAALAGGHGLLWDVLAWRASPDWVTRIGRPGSDVERVNRALVQKTRETLERWRALAGDAAREQRVLLNADIGPRGDGYRVDAADLRPDDARAYHVRQIAALAEAGADVATATTMTTAAEAIGITQAASEHGLPVIVSPTVETDGRLPDGTTLGELIERVDQATDGAPVFYMVNCAHPKHLLPALEAAARANAPWLARLGGFRANASDKSHAELDESPTLDSGDPADLARRMAELAERFALRALGGCCGTDARHLAAIASATAPATQARSTALSGSGARPRLMA